MLLLPKKLLAKQRHINVKKYNKKFKTNVSNLINCWKKGMGDMEIAKSLGIDLFTLKQIKLEIELEHQTIRLQEKLNKASL